MSLSSKSCEDCQDKRAVKGYRYCVKCKNKRLKEMRKAKYLEQLPEPEVVTSGEPDEQDVFLQTLEDGVYPEGKEED